MVSSIVSYLFPLLIYWLCVEEAVAHTAGENGSSAGWNWRPEIVLVLLIFGSIYTYGWLQLRWRGRLAVSYGRLGLYLGGLGALAMALLSPIDALASIRFSMHMVQHLLLVMLAPLFLLLANPLAVFLWGLPNRFRKGVGRLLNIRSRVRRWLRCMTTMPVTWTLYVINLWVWHHPFLYQKALGDGWIHDVEHLLFFFTALLFWWPVANPAPRLHGQISYGFRIAYLIAATLQNTLLGMVISLPERVLYPFYETVPGLRDISPIHDQALGGGIMWVSGHMYLIPILFLIARLFTREEEELKAHPPQKSPSRA